MKRHIILYILFIFSILPKYSYSQWVQCSSGIGVNDKITSVVTGGGYLFAGSAAGGVYRSTDNGSSWQAVNTGLTSQAVSVLYYYSGNLWAGTYGSGIFLSTNNGDSWSAVNTGLTNLYINCIYYGGNKIYAGTSDTLGSSGGVFSTTNNGASWSFIGLGGLSVRSFNLNGNYLIAGTGNNGTTGGIFRTTNNGLNWALSNFGLQGFGIEVNVMSSDGMNIYAGTGAGIYISVNYGGNWSMASLQLSNQKITSIALNGFIFYAGTTNGVFITTNYGLNWWSKNQGFPALTSIMSLCLMNNTLYAGTKENSIWKRDINEIINIRKISDEVPDRFRLEQNYPNPFNPITNIKYQITNNRKVEIKVFDANGRKVETLVNEKQEPGIYEVIWDGTNYPSGIYFYQLSIDNVQCAIRKMVIIK